jgi:hypothetical protein
MAIETPLTADVVDSTLHRVCREDLDGYERIGD